MRRRPHDAARSWARHVSRAASPGQHSLLCSPSTISVDERHVFRGDARPVHGGFLLRPTPESVAPPFQRTLSDDTFWRVVLPFTFGSLEEIEDSRVHDSMLAETHVMTAPWHQFAFEIRNEPTCPSQCRCRVAHDFVLAHEQQHRYVHRPQFVVRQRIRGDTQRLWRHSKMLQTEIHQVQARAEHPSRRERL